MESRGPLAASPGLLLLLLLPLPPHGHQRIQDPPAVRLSSGSGQEPITIMTFDFTKIRKTSSSFELRTWDPEGVIFYGDTNPQEDWFVLGLRDGRPEIQMHNHLAQLTVGARPRLDDGKGHQLVPTLDGCLRRENGLDQQAQTSVSPLTSSLRSCAAESQPGTFFPPGTRAEFSLQESGAVLCVGPTAGSASGLGTPSSAEAGRVWGCLEPEA